MRSKKREARGKKSEARSQKKRKVIRTYKDLEVYRLSYELAMEVFWLTQRFPKEETFRLVSQIRDSSRSVPGNVAEGWAKRRYENVFKRHLTDAVGSCDETKVWLDFSLDCSYVSAQDHDRLMDAYDEVGRMLNGLSEKWHTY